jgi:hypothetical protein
VPRSECAAIYSILHGLWSVIVCLQSIEKPLESCFGRTARRRATRPRQGAAPNYDEGAGLLARDFAAGRRQWRHRRQSDGVGGQALMAMITAPAAIRPMPIHPIADGRSPRKAKANKATSTTLSLSIGATNVAGPSLSARK